MPIERASFIRPVSPRNGIDGTVPSITSGEAVLTLEGAFLRVAWKHAKGTYQLVPLTNVRELHCSEPIAQPSPTPASKPAMPPQSPAKAKAR